MDKSRESLRLNTKRSFPFRNYTGCKKLTKRQVVTRFWEKVVKTPTCWVWQGAANKTPWGHYGVCWDGKRKVYAHRFSYKLAGKKLKAHLTIDHLCRVTRCVNPDHLELVSGRVNTLRGFSVSARNAKKTHCPQGHPYSKENTYVYPQGVNSTQRVCRKCCIRKSVAYKKRIRQQCS